MTKIFFDESGQTGAHLLDRNQPHFTLGSTDIDEAEAADIISACFRDAKGSELKSRSLFRRESGRRAFIAFAKFVGQRPLNFCGAKINKRFTVVCKMVDNLVEPPLQASGYDFYADNYAARFANMAYFAFANLMEESAANGIMEAYNNFARSPSKESLDALRAALRAELSTNRSGAETFLSMMADGADCFEELHRLDQFEDTNDIHVTAAVQCMGFWQERHAGALDVIHDESTHFFKRSPRWEMITNPQAAPVVLQVGDKTLKLPINVRSTSSSKSHECASLQLCDLIAGFVGFVSSPSLTSSEVDFVQEALDRGMNQLSVYPVEPGSEFVDGPPPVADGSDLIDRIIGAVAPRQP